MEDLFDVAGEEYYLDLDRISDFIKLDKENNVDTLLEMSTVDNTDDEPSEGQMIDITKWELTKVMIETILSEQSIVDEDMGVTKLGKQLSIPFRISFNTLLINKILKKNG